MAAADLLLLPDDMGLAHVATAAWAVVQGNDVRDLAAQVETARAEVATLQTRLDIANRDADELRAGIEVRNVFRTAALRRNYSFVTLLAGQASPCVHSIQPVGIRETLIWM